MIAARSPVPRVALTVLSAVLYASSFPPLACHVVAWFALVPLLLALRGTSDRAALALGALWAIVAAEGVGTWFATGVAHYYGRPLAVGALFFAGVSLILAAPFYAAFSAVYARLGRDQRLGAYEPLWAPAAWVACELARARFLVGNPWALLGYTQVGWTPIVQIADLTGVYGVSFVVFATNAAVATCLAKGIGSRAARRGLATAAVLTLTLVVYGVGRMTRPLAAGAPLDVAIVQASTDVGAAWRPELYGANLDAYLRLSHDVLRERPDLVVWPESAVTFFLEDEPAYRAAIARVFGASGAELIAGGPAHDDGDAEHARYFNSAFLIGADAAILDRYDKTRLVPFGEYFPFSGLEPLRRRFAFARVFTPGAPRGPLVDGRHPIGSVICFEAMYPELVSEQVVRGATLLVNLTNDAWMGDTSFAPFHLAIASLRAVESRRYLVRAAATGISAVIDPFGRTVAEIPAFTPGTRTVRVEALDGLTFYARYGDVFAVACAIAAAALAALSGRRRAPAYVPTGRSSSTASTSAAARGLDQRRTRPSAMHPDAAANVAR